MKKRYLAPSVKKAFDILRIISSSQEGMGLNEIASKLNIPKSTAHGIISVLKDVGALTRDPFTRKYELGLTLFELGRQLYTQMDIREVCRPVMEELMEKVQETVFLGALNGDRRSILVLDVVECEHDFKITSPVGSTLPLFAAAPGKALLSIMDKDEAQEIIEEKGLPKYTKKSITDTDRFIEAIEEVHATGIAADYEEYISGVRAIAIPISGGKKHPATMYVVGFKARLNQEKMDILKKEIIEAGMRINRKIKDKPHIS
jgi:IclR family KDG regulon transcriptional repressor